MTRRTQTVPIDDYLKQKVLQRLGRSEGDVRISHETWDMGVCDTCSYPESGFAIYVDEELVWPNDEVLSAQGGYVYADEHGSVDESMNTLTTHPWSLFFDWLQGRDLDRIVEEEF